ncbi:hypothetical protein TNCT_179081 [Trichonephila clavata]|uniref:Uncharacterized protein n=1 Tax=Trichonephila clavata TaxID=2740835 RepID=A0A8X6IPX2_TRICU|nr:hypothetical protein TNCT_179081 [Trichonephila clavata]
MCTCSKRELGNSNFPISLNVCRETFARWHYKPRRAHNTTSYLIADHKYRLATIFRGILTPRCESACRLLKISRLNISGTNRRMRSIDTSQWSVTGGCPTGKGCITREVGQESAKISFNWESFSCSLAILLKSTTDGMLMVEI